MRSGKKTAPGPARTRYRMKTKDLLLYGFLGLLAGGAVGFLFYRSLWTCLILGPAGAAILPLFKKRDLEEADKNRMESELCDKLSALALLLRSGYSFENALKEMKKDVGHAPLLDPEWSRATALTEALVPPEQAFAEMAERTGLSEVESLSSVIEICRSGGGNLAQKISDTVILLKSKERTRAELRVLFAQKKTEQKILNLMPFLVLGLLSLMAGSYLDPLYTTAAGRLLMTVSLLVMMGSILLSQRMAAVEPAGGGE